MTRESGTRTTLRGDTAEQRACLLSFARGHAGEIAHGVEMLRHWWPGPRQEARDAWLRQLEKYAPSLVGEVDALATEVERLEKALAEIESFPISGYHAGAAQRIARAALGGGEPHGD